MPITSQQLPSSQPIIDYKDAATTAALIDEQQAFTESLSTGFWYE